MNQNICYNCGGEEFAEKGGKYICLHCGTIKPEDISGEEVTLLYNAYQRLRLSDFFDAEQQFDDIVHRYPRNAQGYWGRLLAKYGIKYEDDYDGTKIPTCYATSIESFFEASDYKKALEHADEDNRAVFQKHAEYIERVRKEWVEKAGKQKQYDIFISYKDSELIQADGDSEGKPRRTQDSYDMQELYHYLKDQGYRVFFSRESLSKMTGEKYEPYIYNALCTAKVMILYGSNPEYIDATWVKNEWMRYMKFMREGEKSPDSLIVVYKGFSPSELPGPLKNIQNLDKDHLQFLEILCDKIRGLVKNSKCKHKPVVMPRKAPTCTLPGLTEMTYCSECGETLKAGEVIPPTGHLFGEWTLSKKATCTEDGEYERACACGEREIKGIPSRGGHIPSPDWEVVTEPAPGKEGFKVKRCTICEEIIAEKVIPALPRVLPSENLAYRVNPDGRTCTVTGCGECKDRELLIPSEIDGFLVTAIGTDPKKNRFLSGFYKDVTSIVLPASVSCIGDSVFKGCQSLRSITIPNFVTEIGKAAFWGCSGLTEIVIPDTVQRIEKDTFWGCSGLKNITIPDSVETIGEWAFAGCKSLTTVTLPSRLKNIEAFLFQDCENLTSIELPESIFSIGNEAFRGCTRLVSVVIPKSVGSIGKMAFLDCVSLTELTIPDSVTAIEDRAFESCTGLSNVRLPESLRSLGSHIFCGCMNLHAIRYEGSRDQWNRIRADHDWKTGSFIQKIDLHLPISQGLQYNINKDGKTCTIVGQGMCKDKELVIPRKIGSYVVTRIESCQPYGSGFDKDITSVHMPDSVTEIGDRAFSGCSFLTEAGIPNSVTKIGEYAFADCERLVTVKIPKSAVSIAPGTFFKCANLDSLEIPDGVTSIGEKAFWYCTGLTSVKLSDSVTEIGENAFCGCNHLKTMLLPTSVTHIGKSALAGVGRIDVHSDHPCYTAVDGHLYSKDKKTFIHYDVTKKSGFFALPELVNIIDENAFTQNEWLASVSLPESLTKIGASAFSGCSSLTSLLYTGTKRGWKKIKTDKYWKENSMIREVNCTNGTVKIK